MAQVKYKISGEYDGQAVASAKSGLQELGSAVESVTKVVQGFMALEGVRIIGEIVGETLAKYEDQQAGIVKLTTAIDSDSKLAAGSLQRILDYTTQLQEHSIFGKNALDDQAAILASMRLTEAQIKNVLTAATGLASAGIGTLDTNVKQLAGTLEGSAGRLSKLVPGLQNLSKAQLEAGDAIQIVADRYGKFNAAVAEGTLAGQTALTKNLWDEIEVKVGSVFAIGKGAFLEAALPNLQKMNEQLGEVTTKITKGVNQQQLAQGISSVIQFIGAAFKLLWDLVWTTGSAAIIKPFVLMGQVAWIVLADTWKAFQNIFSNIGLIWANVAYGIKSAFQTSINFAIDLLNKFVDLYNGLVGKVLGPIGQIGRLDLDIGAKPDTVAWDKILSPFADTMSKVGDKITAFGKDQVDAFRNLGTDLVNLKNAILNPTQLNNATNAAANLGGGGSGDTPDNPPSKEKSKAGKPTAETDNGEVSGLTTMFNGVMGDLSQSFSGLGAAGGMLSGVFQSLMAGAGPIGLLLIVLKPVVDAFVKTIMPTINKLLQPFIGFLTILGNTIGALLIPILDLLSPILKLVAIGFMYSYNYGILPFVNACIFVFNLLYDVVATIWNAIASAINAVLGWLGVHVSKMSTKGLTQGFLSPISMSDMEDAGADTSGTAAGTSTSSTGTGASYAAANTYNIYVTNQFATASVIDSSGSWNTFMEKVMRSEAILATANVGLT